MIVVLIFVFLFFILFCHNFFLFSVCFVRFVCWFVILFCRSMFKHLNCNRHTQRTCKKWLHHHWNYLKTKTIKHTPTHTHISNFSDTRAHRFWVWSLSFWRKKNSSVFLSFLFLTPCVVTKVFVFAFHANVNVCDVVFVCDVDGVHFENENLKNNDKLNTMCMFVCRFNGQCIC